MPESPIEIFDSITAVERPNSPSILFDRAAVLGGSIAGLLAARVLSDHAREVLIIERDEIGVVGSLRTGVPQGGQGHGLLPGGLMHIERWLPGLTNVALDLGGVLASPGQRRVYLDGEQKGSSGESSILMGTRPFLESRIRSGVLALPNVSVIRAHVTGLNCQDGAVRSVRYTRDGAALEIEVDFVVDAMGRASKLSGWVEQCGYDRPQLQRVQTGIKYSTALFERSAEPADLEVTCALAQFSPSPSPDAFAAGAVNAVESGQWLVMLMTYGDKLPGRSLEDFRAACAELPPIFGKVAASPMTQEIVTYHQGDSRRRDFTSLARFPARLVSVGDAVASFNPIYGQGVTIAAMHAACLSAYLTGEPNLIAPASRFFQWQDVLVDAAWITSTGNDAARWDAVEGREVPEEVQQHRWVMGQLMRASLHDPIISRAFGSVAFMLKHPFTLRDPKLLERAIAVNQSLGTEG